MLAGSWRRAPTSLHCRREELEEIAPLLLRSGAAALSWRRVQSSDLRATPAAKQLHQTYRRYALQAALQEESIIRVFNLLRSAGIEPILVKGWAVARLYHEQGLRQCGDIDLCVSPEQYVAALSALESFEDTSFDIDVHCGFDKFGGERFSDFYDRSELIKLNETDVRVLSAEDHLRVLSIHMLREGAWRALWLCDIAVAVESLQPANFDWDYCLGENRRQADWIICAIKLAGQLLGANTSNTPAAQRKRQLPRWLVPAILKEWESKLPSMTQRHRSPMSSYVHHPAGILRGLRHRWPNPIEATVTVRASFNELPRLPFQLVNCLARTAKFTCRLPKSLRQQ